MKDSGQHAWHSILHSRAPVTSNDSNCFSHAGLSFCLRILREEKRSRKALVCEIKKTIIHINIYESSSLPEQTAIPTFWSSVNSELLCWDCASFCRCLANLDGMKENCRVGTKHRNTPPHTPMPQSPENMSAKRPWQAKHVRLMLQIVLGALGGVSLGAFLTKISRTMVGHTLKNPEDGQGMRLHEAGKTTYVMYHEGRTGKKVLLANSPFYKHWPFPSPHPLIL